MALGGGGCPVCSVGCPAASSVCTHRGRQPCVIELRQARMSADTAESPGGAGHGAWARRRGREAVGSAPCLPPLQHPSPTCTTQPASQWTIKGLAETRPSALRVGRGGASTPAHPARSRILFAAAWVCRQAHTCPPSPLGLHGVLCVGDGGSPSALGPWDAGAGEQLSRAGTP